MLSKEDIEIIKTLKLDDDGNRCDETVMDCSKCPICNDNLYDNYGIKNKNDILRKEGVYDKYYDIVTNSNKGMTSCACIIDYYQNHYNSFIRRHNANLLNK